MGRVNDTISNVNAAIRNFLLAALVGGAGFAGYIGYDLYNAPRKQLQEKEQQLAEKDGKLQAALADLTVKEKANVELLAKNKDLADKYDRAQLSLKLLKVRHRLARLTVLDQHEVPSLIPATPTGNEAGASRPNVMTKIEFVDINDQGQPIGKPKTFDIKGDMI